MNKKVARDMCLFATGALSGGLIVCVSKLDDADIKRLSDKLFDSLEKIAIAFISNS